MLEGVAGTDSPGRPLPMPDGGLLIGSDGGGMDVAAASSRAELLPALMERLANDELASDTTGDGAADVDAEADGMIPV